MSTPTPGIDERPLSALPSARARLAAFFAICVGGLAGGVIGWALVEAQCSGDCGLAAGVGILAGSFVAAIGMSIVSVLTLRAIGEWNEIDDRAAAGHAPR